MKQEIMYVRSLENYLETQIQPILKNPSYIKNGRPFKNIKLRPREVLGAFLICILIRYLSNQDWTIARDPENGDGVIICMDKNRLYEGAFLEQVYVPRINNEQQIESSEIINKIQLEIQKKHSKGNDYIKHRHLVIFLDIEGGLDHQKIKSYIQGLEPAFDSYWLFANYERPGDAYSFIVFLIRAEFEKDEPAAYSVKIGQDFRSWTINLIGNI